MRIAKALFLLVVFALVTGCASGPKYAEVAASIPPVPADKGRIYFFRHSTMLGAAVTSDISLNNKVVGRSETGGFFFVDEVPGNCAVSTSTEVEKQSTFTLAAGETKYVRTFVTPGLLVGRITPQLVNADEFKAEIESLSYTGSLIAVNK